MLDVHQEGLILWGGHNYEFMIRFCRTHHVMKMQGKVGNANANARELAFHNFNDMRRITGSGETKKGVFSTLGKVL